MRLGADSYDIVIKRGALSNLGQLTDLANRKVFIVTDTGVPIQYAETVKAQCADGSIFVVPQGEASKSIKVYTTVLQAMLEFGMTRADLVVAVGGGVVGFLDISERFRPGETQFQPFQCHCLVGMADSLFYRGLSGNDGEDIKMISGPSNLIRKKER